MGASRTFSSDRFGFPVEMYGTSCPKRIIFGRLEKRSKQRQCSSRSRAADETSKPIELIGSQILVRVEEKFKQGGNHADTGNLLFVQSPPESAALEFAIQDDAAFAIEWGQERNYGAVHVVDRKDAHQAIVYPDIVADG